MKKWFLCIGLALFIGAFVGCKKESPTEPEIKYTIENYFPLAVGNEWIYRDISYDNLEDVTPYDTIIDTIIDTMVVVETYKLEGKDVFKMTEDSYSTHYVYYDGELRWYMDPPVVGDTFYFLLLKEPLEEGKSWWLFPWADTSDIYEIVSTEFTLNTPSGDFADCIKISSDMSEEHYFVLAPGVGLVKAYQRWSDGNWYEKVILEYDIK